MLSARLVRRSVAACTLPPAPTCRRFCAVMATWLVPLVVVTACTICRPWDCSSAPSMSVSTMSPVVVTASSLLAAIWKLPMPVAARSVSTLATTSTAASTAFCVMAPVVDVSSTLPADVMALVRVPWLSNCMSVGRSSGRCRKMPADTSRTRRWLAAVTSMRRALAALAPTSPLLSRCTWARSTSPAPVSTKSPLEISVSCTTRLRVPCTMRTLPADVLRTLSVLACVVTSTLVDSSVPAPSTALPVRMVRLSAVSRPPPATWPTLPWARSRMSPRNRLVRLPTSRSAGARSASVPWPPLVSSW